MMAEQRLIRVLKTFVGYHDNSLVKQTFKAGEPYWVGLGLYASLVPGEDFEDIEQETASAETAEAKPKRRRAKKPGPEETREENVNAGTEVTDEAE